MEEAETQGGVTISVRESRGPRSRRLNLTGGPYFSPARILPSSAWWGIIIAVNSLLPTDRDAI
jgi:hypothetical protein